MSAMKSTVANIDHSTHRNAFYLGQVTRTPRGANRGNTVVSSVFVLWSGRATVSYSAAYSLLARESRWYHPELHIDEMEGTADLGAYRRLVYSRALDAVDFKESHIFDLSKAIRMADIRLSDILAQHAEQLGEVDAEDPAPAPHPAYMFMLERASSPSPPLDSTPRRLKRPRRSSPESLAAVADVANADSGVDSGLNALGVPHQVREKKRPEKHKANRSAKRERIQAVDGHALKSCALERVLARSPRPWAWHWKPMPSLLPPPGEWADGTAPSRTWATAAFKISKSRRDGFSAGRKPSPSRMYLITTEIPMSSA
ncbi:hypothetical protein DFH09DRAFT_1089643 [Mycena vulgaris]|nr:hypothetical protein DFH09DRAFT_1089643 [Mycena vulgaris]